MIKYNDKDLKDTIGWIDTHCHLQYSPLRESIEQVVSDAKQANVKKMVCISTDLDKVDEMIDLIKVYDNIFFTIGQHPLNSLPLNSLPLHSLPLNSLPGNSTDSNTQDNLSADRLYFELDSKLNSLIGLDKLVDSDQMMKEVISHKLVGIGETGLDCNSQDLLLQKEIFHAHLELAGKYDLPVVVHSREMDTELIASLKEYDNVRGVLHCWTGSCEAALQAIELGWKISFSGIITFKKKVEYLQEMIVKLPLESIVIETDSPYLAPDPYRGKTNQPAFVKLVGEKISQLRSIDLIQLQHVLWENSHQLFSKI